MHSPATLDALVRTAIQIDNRVQERERGKQGGKGHSSHSHATLAPSLGSPKFDEPMQVDSSFVPQAHNDKRKKIVCFHCNKPGRIKPRCPELKGNGKSF